MKRRKNANLLVVVICCMVILTGCGCSSDSIEEAPVTEGVLQIQSLEHITLDEKSEIPYQIKTYGTSEEAYNNAIVLKKDAVGNSATISFSFIGNSKSIYKIKDGLIVEKISEFQELIGGMYQL